MHIITRYDHKKGKATVSLEQRRIQTGCTPKAEHEWKVRKTKHGGIDVYAEETFPITSAAAIQACQNRLYQQMSERIEAARRSLNHLPAAISRRGGKQRD